MGKRTVKLDPRHDWLGPPDPESKIRPIQLRQVVGETDVERNYRLEREKLNRFNSTFWAHHNRLFEQSKADFINEVHIEQFDICKSTSFSINKNTERFHK
jgi:hypothetical protein